MNRAYLLALLIVAACDTSRSGANDRLTFTPTNCGLVAGCDFTDSVAAGGQIDLQIASKDGTGTATAGLDLASRDPAIATIAPIADIAGVPAWRLTAVAPGVVDVAAVDRGGAEIDFVEVPILAPTSFGLDKFVGNAVGPTAAAGGAEGWTVKGGDLVSFYVLARNTDRSPLMGRFAFDTVDGAALLASEQEGSDRPHGYLYVKPPVGEYAISFNVTGHPTQKVDVVVHAVATLPSP